MSFSDDAGTMIKAKAIALVGEHKVSYYEDGASLDSPFAVITMPGVSGDLAVCSIAKGFELRFLGESKLFMIGFAMGIYQVYDYWAAPPTRSLS